MAEAWGHKITYIVYQPGPYVDDGHGFNAALKLSDALPDNAFVGMMVEKVHDDPTGFGSFKSVKGITNIGGKRGRCG